MAIDIMFVIELVHHIGYRGSCLPNIGRFYTGFHSREITKIGIGRRSSMLESSGKHYLSITIAPTCFLAYSYLGVRLIRGCNNGVFEHYTSGQGTVFIGNGDDIPPFYLMGGLMYHRIIKIVEPKLIITIYNSIIGTCLWQGIGIGELFWEAWKHHSTTLYFYLEVISIELITGYLIGYHTISVRKLRYHSEFVFSTIGTSMSQVKAYGFCRETQRIRLNSFSYTVSSYIFYLYDVVLTYFQTFPIIRFYFLLGSTCSRSFSKGMISIGGRDNQLIVLLFTYFDFKRSRSISIVNLNREHSPRTSYNTLLFTTL